MYKQIKAANEEAEDTVLEDTIKDLKNGFEYLIDTFDILDSKGKRDEVITFAQEALMSVDDIIYKSVKLITPVEE